MDPNWIPESYENSKSIGLNRSKRVCEGSTSADSLLGDSDVIKKVRVSENDQSEKVPINDICNISSDDDDDEDRKLVKSTSDKGKSIESNLGLVNGIEINVENEDVVGCSSLTKRYTVKEKGKEKVDEFKSVSHANSPGRSDLNFGSILDSDEDDQTQFEEFQMEEAARILQSLISAPEAQEVSKKMPVNDQDRLVDVNRDRLREEQRVREIQANLRREEGYRDRERKERIEKARELAHFGSKEDVKEPSKVEMTTEGFSGPFSSALKAIQDRNTKELKNLFQGNVNSSNFQPRIVPSLLDLSLDVLVRNAEAVSSFEHVPEKLKQKIANLLCDYRKMDMDMLELLMEDSPTEIRVKNCSWMTEAQFVKTFQKLDMQNLRVLQLDLCGQISFDDIICKTLAQSPNSLPCLGILSLRGAGRLSDNTLKPLIMSAPLLQSVNISQCAILTSVGIKILADVLKDNLRELYIDDCPLIDAMCLIPSMNKFEHLEVLSMEGIETVCDEFVRGLMAACGGNLKELNLANCPRLTNGSLEAIGNLCPQLCSLNISNLRMLTDIGIGYLANGCRFLQSLKMAGNKFSDEVVAAFLETSGGSLKELSLNKVQKVSFNTALSLAKCSRKLTSLDLSWCREITNEALGLIVDSCSSLRLLKLFGCTQIERNFAYSHRNPQVQMVGLNQETPLLQHVNMFEPLGVLLHYSPLKSPV